MWCKDYLEIKQSNHFQKHQQLFHVTDVNGFLARHFSSQSSPSVNLTIYNNKTKLLRYSNSKRSEQRIHQDRNNSEFIHSSRWIHSQHTQCIASERNHLV